MKFDDVMMRYEFVKTKYLAPYELKFCSAFINKYPRFAEAYIDRGHIYNSVKKYSKAIADYTKALEIEQDAFTYRSRADAYMALKKYKYAIKDLKNAVRLESKKKEKNSDYLVKLADCYEEAGQYNLAIKIFNSLIKDKKANVYIHFHLARIYASCNDARFRNGKKAIFHAKKADVLRKIYRKSKKLKIGSSALHLDLLAAAYAQAGQFKKAVTLQKKAVKQMQNHQYLPKLESRLNLYQSRRPYIRKRGSTGGWL